MRNISDISDTGIPGVGVVTRTSLKAWKFRGRIQVFVQWFAHERRTYFRAFRRAD